MIRTTRSSFPLSPAATEACRNSSSFIFISSRRTTTIQAKNERSEIVLAEGPSCLFVGPVETASKDMLEALYLQARDSYYSGRPLVLDDMFDKVELMLRRYGSQSVVKYPRCSLKRQSTYSDAEVGGTGGRVDGFGISKHMDFVACLWEPSNTHPVYPHTRHSFLGQFKFRFS